jgi:serine/threonine-protein kinase HipA
LAKHAKILYDGVLAAILSETDDGYVLQYDETYLQKPESKPISLTLPKRKEPYKSKVLFPFFDGLIPEGWLLDIAVTHWKLKPNDRFELLLAACHDTIGAVTVEPEINLK